MTLIELINSELSKLDDAFDEFAQLQSYLTLERKPLPKILSYGKLYRLTQPITAKKYIINPSIVLELKSPCEILNRPSRDMVVIYFHQGDQEFYVSLQEFIANAIEVE